MKNAILIIIVFGVLAWYFLYFRNKKTRPEMIDYLNRQVGNNGGVWTKLEDNELKDTYEYVRLIQLNGGDFTSAIKHIPSDLKQRVDILQAKYAIFGT